MSVETPDTGTPVRPEVPSLPLVEAANRGLADPDFRASVRKMHEEDYPLVKMVEALGLEDDLTDQVRAIVEALSPEVVAAIRKATLAMLDSADDKYEMPLNCTVSNDDVASGMPVDVKVESERGEQTIHVRPDLTS